MSKNAKAFLLLLILIFSSFALSCGSNQESNVKIDSSDNSEVVFDEEIEGAEISINKVSVDKFFGSWTATSEQSQYMLGNVDVTVKKDGSWHGNIADEVLSGKWKECEDGIYLTSDLFNFTLSYTKKGTLIMQHDLSEESPEAEGEDPLVVVLTAK